MTSRPPACAQCRDRDFAAAEKQIDILSAADIPLLAPTKSPPLTTADAGHLARPTYLREANDERASNGIQKLCAAQSLPRIDLSKARRARAGGVERAASAARKDVQGWPAR